MEKEVENVGSGEVPRASRELGVYAKEQSEIIEKNFGGLRRAMFTWPKCRGKYGKERAEDLDQTEVLLCLVDKDISQQCALWRDQFNQGKELTVDLASLEYHPEELRPAA